MQNFNSQMIKFTVIQESHLAADNLVNFIIQEMKFSQVAQLFMFRFIL